MKKYLALLTIIIVAICGCVNPSFIKDNHLGKKYSGSITVENKTVPLPDGEWIVVGRGYGDSYDYGEVLLAQVSARRIAKCIIIRSDASTNSFSGYRAAEDAQRTDLYHVVVKSNTTGEPLDFWYVSHYIMSVTPKREAVKQFFEYCKVNSITMPKLFIRSRHTLTGVGMKHKYLNVEYYYNPDVEGFDTSKEDNWGTSSWHYLRIKDDPKKVSYMEKIKRDNEMMHEKLRDGFRY